MNTIGKHIKAILKERKIHQSTLAGLLGISREAFYPMLQGTTNPSDEIVKQIEEILDVEIPYKKIRGYAGYKLIIIEDD